MRGENQGNVLVWKKIITASLLTKREFAGDLDVASSRLEQETHEVQKRKQFGDNEYGALSFNPKTQARALNIYIPTHFVPQPAV